MIKLIKGYPHDNTYDYIKLHSSKSAQENYFNTFDHIFVDEGEEEGYIKEGNAFIVEYNYDYLVDQGVNYVIWNNGHKDLYCFIIAKEFVESCPQFKGFEVLIATHQDREHIHTHFILNSVSFEDGHKLQWM